MKVIQSHKIIYVDVDDTLLIMDWRSVVPNADTFVTITDPESKTTMTAVPHYRHIELLKQFKARGHTIVVWSQGGWAWAEEAVKILDLEKYVDVVISKPDWYMDDLPAQAFMGSNIYKHPTDPTKDKKRFVEE